MSQQYIQVAAAGSECPENEILLITSLQQDTPVADDHHSQKPRCEHTAYTQKIATESWTPQPNNIHTENKYRKLHVPTKQDGTFFQACSGEQSDRKLTSFHVLAH